MNVMNYLDYNSIADIRRTMSVQDTDGIVVQKQNATQKSQSSQQSNSFQTEEYVRRDLLPTNQVVDFAINSDMKTDKELIGSESSLENLDVTRAISDMQKDSILKEYQVFVQNPESEDGIVMRKANING